MPTVKELSSPIRRLLGGLIHRPDLKGAVDRVVGYHLTGWAADFNDLTRRLVVEVCAGPDVITSAVADQFREGHVRAGIGDGRHGFQCTVPRSFSPSHLDLVVRVRARGATFVLPTPGEIPISLDSSVFLDFVAADLVDNCNLRCPFRLVDYSRVKKTNLMSEDTFIRLLQLIDHVPEQGFWLSCLHEPTLHPRLNHFLDLIPRENRKKVWFTTNLAKPLSEETFRAWARSGIHHINVSLDSTNPDLFAFLRKFGRYETFERNLDLMTKVFEEVPARERPKLRYITMAFKSNLDEIPTLVERCHRRWLSYENEIRYTYNVIHITDDFRRQQYLDREDWSRLTEALDKLPFRYTIAYPPENGYEEELQPSANFADCSEGSRPTQSVADLERPLSLRARPDGTLLVVGREHEFAWNVNTLSDPVGHFRKL